MNKKQYFASSNSMMGFQSYFNSIYDPTKLKKIYIIKGGPGTGKSSTMKAIGEMFEKEHDCEYFLCSSDPSSLDGIIIDNEVAVIDGTAPHVTEAKYPSAVETLIDNAIGISSDISERKNEIIELSKEKAKFYRYAYTYLKAAGEIKQEQTAKLYSKIDHQKMESAISRYFKQNFKVGDGFRETVRLTEAIAPSGMYKTQGFESLSKKTTLIINGKGYEEIILSAIVSKAKEYRLNTMISYDPLVAFSPNAVYFSNNSTCVVKYCKQTHSEIDYDKYKVINFDRFIDRSCLNEIKPNLKFAQKCLENLIQEATANLSMASVMHKKLEEIYVKYTDFSKIDDNIEIIANGITEHFSMR